MEIPMTRASAYQKRNRTTHSWYADWSTAGSIMSQSCPSARTLEEHMRNARAAMSVSSSFYQPRHGAKSMSLPGAYNRASSGSRAAKQSPSPLSSASSPGFSRSAKTPDGVPGKGKPDSAYSYDGGFFVTANNANKDFFVIDPEWVSEVETIKKLPTGYKEKKKAKQQASPRVLAARTFKRSKSAPPPKHRQNPITWQM